MDMCQEYVDSLGKGLLLKTQMHLAVQASRMLCAFAKVGIIALVDEATGYQAQRAACELSFAYRAILLESQRDWDLMWPAECVVALCSLHGVRYIGGSYPHFLASTFDRLYRAILGDAVVDELKRRNPEPKFGTNHHQWLTPEAREVVRRNIDIVTLLARQSGSKDEFWARIDNQFRDESLQLGLYVPQRRIGS